MILYNKQYYLEVCIGGLSLIYTIYSLTIIFVQHSLSSHLNKNLWLQHTQFEKIPSIIAL